MFFVAPCPGLQLVLCWPAATSRHSGQVALQRNLSKSTHLYVPGLKLEEWQNAG